MTLGWGAAALLFLVFVVAAAALGASLAAEQAPDGAAEAKLPAILPCGCSRLKVGLGFCDIYAPDGSPRPGKAEGLGELGGVAPDDPEDAGHA